MDGFVFAVIFRSILKNKNDEEKLKKLDALKDNSTPAIRLYNWGIIAEMLKQIGYNL
ncbi:MAG: hypothetical protein KBC84_11550 [Proteobacteria bacterium]|nr:hypothetical protein [Pseudomonadota bacterium]